MALLAQQLLRSQHLTQMAAIAERHYRVNGITGLQVIADTYAEARRLAGNFAVYADFHPAANDEPHDSPDQA